jgi:hypothetical protein
MADAWSPSHSHYPGSKRLRITDIIHMTDEPVQSLDVDELAYKACDCLNQFRDKGIDRDDSIQRSRVKRAVDANNSKKPEAPSSWCEVPKMNSRP